MTVDQLSRGKIMDSLTDRLLNFVQQNRGNAFTADEPSGAFYSGLGLSARVDLRAEPFGSGSGAPNAGDPDSRPPTHGGALVPGLNVSWNRLESLSGHGDEEFVAGPLRR
jgi:hypothetical protein